MNAARSYKPVRLGSNRTSAYGFGYYSDYDIEDRHIKSER